MDDFNVSNLHESKNEWSSRLVTIMTPLIIEGIRSIFDEAVKLCQENNEMDKYLMTFQNFISRIPKWNQSIIDQEKKRIMDKSGCTYLEDLVTCVHIIQLKILTAMRVGQKQKKIDLNIPKLEDFIHKSYINVARKLYKNVYLFELNIPPLQTQKNYRELEIIVQECIALTLRESIPVESILRAYMDETVEEEVVEEIKEQMLDKHADSEKSIDNMARQAIEQAKQNTVTTVDVVKSVQPAIEPASEPTSVLDTSTSKLSFNDIDFTRDSNNNESTVVAPKDYERLEELSNLRNEQRKQDEAEDNEDKLKIFDEEITLDNMDIHNIDMPEIQLSPDDLLSDIEVLA